MKQLIQRWLGLDVILWHLQDIRENRLSDRKLLNKMDLRLTDVIAPGMARVLNKLDPQFARSEFDPQRIAESDAIADATIARLRAEAAARAPYDLLKED